MFSLHLFFERSYNHPIPSPPFPIYAKFTLCFFSLSHRICTFVKSKQDKLGQTLMKKVSSSHSSVWKHIDHVMGSRSLANIVEKVQAAGLLGRL